MLVLVFNGGLRVEKIEITSGCMSAGLMAYSGVDDWSRRNDAETVVREIWSAMIAAWLIQSLDGCSAAIE